MRIRRAVWSKKAIEAEIAVIRLVPEIAAVCPELIVLKLQLAGRAQFATILRLCDTLVHPVPDGGTHYG